MTTTMLDRVPVDRISRQAREVHFTRTLLTLIAGLLFGAGWLAYKVFSLSWLALAWCAVAVREGWREARNAQVTRGLAGTG